MMKEANEICPTTTMAVIKKGALLIDVREKNEVEQLAFDVPKIMNIPLSEFEDRFTEIPKNEELVMVCKSGARSLRATYFLMNNGYEHVSNMQYGMTQWVKKGFPTSGNVNSLTETDSSSGCCETESSGGNCC